MYIKNSIGPRTVPWGTPERTGWGGGDCDPSETTLCDLPCRKCWTLSNALLKSIMIISVCEVLLDRSWKRERS